MKNDRQEPSIYEQHRQPKQHDYYCCCDRAHHEGVPDWRDCGRNHRADESCDSPHVANDIPQSINNDDDISTLIDIPHIEVNVVTNNAYLNGWLKKNGYSARLVDDEGILNVLENEDIMTTIVVPAAENLAMNPENGEISLPPDENNILVRVQDEILRSDDNGQRVHDTFITLMLPPEYRMTPSNIDPDTYIRVVAMPTYVHLADQDPEANTDA